LAGAFSRYFWARAKSVHSEQYCFLPVRSGMTSLLQRGHTKIGTMGAGFLSRLLEYLSIYLLRARRYSDIRKSQIGSAKSRYSFRNEHVSKAKADLGVLFGPKAYACLALQEHGSGQMVTRRLQLAGGDLCPCWRATRNRLPQLILFAMAV